MAAVVGQPIEVLSIAASMEQVKLAEDKPGAAAPEEVELPDRDSANHSPSDFLSNNLASDTQSEVVRLNLLLKYCWFLKIISKCRAQMTVERGAQTVPMLMGMLQDLTWSHPLFHLLIIWHLYLSVYLSMNLKYLKICVVSWLVAMEPMFLISKRKRAPAFLSKSKQDVIDFNFVPLKVIPIIINQNDKKK